MADSYEDFDHVVRLNVYHDVISGLLRLLPPMAWGSLTNHGHLRLHDVDVMHAYNAAFISPVSTMSVGGSLPLIF